MMQGVKRTAEASGDAEESMAKKTRSTDTTKKLDEVVENEDKQESEEVDSSKVPDSSTDSPEQKMIGPVSSRQQPVQPKKEKAQPPSDSETWDCGVCGNWNYTTRNRCNLRSCGAPRGTVGPHGHGGLESTQLAALPNSSLGRCLQLIHYCYLP